MAECNRRFMGQQVMERFKRECSQWFYTNSTKPEGVVLLVHGLNQKPSSWSDLIEYLNSINLHVYRLALKGHRGLTFDDMHSVNAQVWQDELIAAHNEMQQHFCSLPLYLVAYSLGSLVAVSVQLKAGQPLFDRQILLAPALAIRPYTRLALPLCTLLAHLPSRSPRGYIANTEGTTAEAYRALFQLEKEVRQCGNFSIVNVPTQIMMRPDDELISYTATGRLLKKNKLDKWRLVPLVDDSCAKRCSFSYKHLIVDQRSAGGVIWGRMTAEIGRFLKTDQPSPGPHQE